MKEVYIIQSYSGTIPAKLIKLFTKYEYSHISISLDKSLTKMYSFGRKNINNFLNSGFIMENKNGEFFKKFNNTYCRIYKLEVNYFQYKKLKSILKKYEKNPDKYKYDLIGIVLKIFKINIKRKNHYVCSQFVAEVLNNSNIYNFNKSPKKVKPSDFDSISNNIIYTGKIKEYQF